MFLAHNIQFLKMENTYIYIARTNFNHDLLKMLNFGTKINTPPSTLKLEVSNLAVMLIRMIQTNLAV